MEVTSKFITQNLKNLNEISKFFEQNLKKRENVCVYACVSEGDE